MKKTAMLPVDIIEKMDFPEEALNTASKITVTAGRRMLIENHRGVTDFSDEQITVAVVRGKICVQGTALTIKAMNRSELLISGRIQNVEWV